MREKALRGSLLAVVITAVVLAWTSPMQAQTTKLIFSSGPSGGSWIPLAAATAEVVRSAYPEVAIDVEPGGTLVNMEKIMQDKAHLGWTMSTAMAEARARKGRWSEKPVDKIRYVASYFPNVWQMATPADSGIRTVADLKGKAVALPTRAAASLDYGWLPLLQAYGLSMDQLGTKSYGSISENAELLKNRQAAAMGWLTAAPASFMLDLVSSQKIRLIPVSEEAIKQVIAMNPGFSRYVIPKGTYTGIDEDVVTIQASTSLIVGASVSSDVVYKITKGVVENNAKFASVSSAMKSVTPADMARNYGIPLHPGAERYYREAGLLK
jgi:TRAP transporter TAXI family solute receptor